MVTLYNSLLTDFDSLSISPYKSLINLNIGAAYSEMKEGSKSLEYTYRVLSSENEIHKGLALNNIGETYLNMIKNNVQIKDIPLIENISLESNNEDNEPIILELVFNYLNKSVEDFSSVGATNYKVHPLVNLGKYYDYVGNKKEAESSFSEAWEIAEENHLLNEQRIIAEKLYLINKEQKDTKETLKWHEKYSTIKDSLNSKENQQEMGKQFAQFEYNNIRLKDSLEQVKKDEIQQIKIDQQERNIEAEQLKKYYLFGGLIGTFLLLLILFRRFNITKKQKKLIELQKTEMERKQVELSKSHLAIRDSINYSKKIQKAIFPSPNYVNHIFPENFILFQPKDVVSGDFYWCHEVGNKKIIALADCTGHGVPGAFMTIVGINILKEVVQEGITDSKVILKEINSKLKKRLGQNGQKVKDGMDIGICIIDDTTVEFSGAHFSLYHISENDFVEYKGNNTFLGNEDEVRNIKAHYIPYKKGDLIYMSTDGFPDQKGGAKGKKFFYKPLRELILKNSTKTMVEQKDLLKTEFKNWIAVENKKQMDDVSIVGIKL
jgi:serine phosphatase RsbU (regulator of sigma subunit)